VHPALKVLLVAIPVLFVGDRLGALLLHQVVEKSRDRYVQMYLGASPAEVVVIGNSRAADQFPPSLMRDKLGVRVVNLGLGGVSMVMNEVLFRDYVQHNGKPKLLVIEPTNLTVDPSGIGDMRLFTIFSERMEQLVREQEPVHYYTQQLFHLFRYNNENLVRVIYGVVREPEDRLHHGVITPELVRIVKGRNLTRLTNFPPNEVALDRILAFANGMRRSPPRRAAWFEPTTMRPCSASRSTSRTACT
jgi:hypothetical protein